jgi:hypothetical protein
MILETSHVFDQFRLRLGVTFNSFKRGSLLLHPAFGTENLRPAEDGIQTAVPQFVRRWPKIRLWRGWLPALRGISGRFQGARLIRRRASSWAKSVRSMYILSGFGDTNPIRREPCGVRDWNNDSGAQSG